jgi:hypothetical protein
LLFVVPVLEWRHRTISAKNRSLCNTVAIAGISEDEGKGILLSLSALLGWYLSESESDEQHQRKHKPYTSVREGTIWMCLTR